MVQFLCLTIDGGFRLVYRALDNTIEVEKNIWHPLLYFSWFPPTIITSLSSLKTFGDEKGIEIQSTKIGGMTTVWKDFERLRIIVITRDQQSTQHLTKTIENFLHLVCMTIGRNRLQQFNHEIMKRQFNKLGPIIDIVLEGLGPLDSHLFMNDLTDTKEVEFPSAQQAKIDEMCSAFRRTNFQESKNFGFNYDTEQKKRKLNFLDNFIKTCGCDTGCLLNASKLLACTKSWWELSQKDTLILVNMARTVNNGEHFFNVIVSLGETEMRRTLHVMKVSEVIWILILLAKVEEGSRMDKDMKGLKKEERQLLTKLEEELAIGKNTIGIFDNPLIQGFCIIDYNSRRHFWSTQRRQGLADKKTYGKILNAIRSYYGSMMERILWEEKSTNTNVTESFLVTSSYKLYEMLLLGSKIQIIIVYEKDTGIEEIRGDPCIPSTLKKWTSQSYSTR